MSGVEDTDGSSLVAGRGIVRMDIYGQYSATTTITAIVTIGEMQALWEEMRDPYTSQAV